jgi:hypothetical protein
MRRVVVLVGLVLVALLAPSSAIAAPSLLSVSPQRVNFGTKTVGTTTFKTVTVTNTSRSRLFVRIDGGLPDDFGWGPLSLEQDLCALGGELLAPGDTCQAFVRFSPSEFFVQFGRQAGTLQVTASDPSTLSILQTTVVDVTGTGR